MTQGFTRMAVGALLLAGALPAQAQSKMVTLAEVAQGQGLDPAAYPGLVTAAADLLTGHGARLLVVGLPPQDRIGRSAAEVASDEAVRPVVQAAFRDVVAARPGELAFLSLDTVLGDATGAYRRYLPDPSGALQLVRKAYEALPSGGAFIVHDCMIDDDRRERASGILMSLNMLIETPDGYDYTAKECEGWMRQAGFRQMRNEHLAGADWMMVGIK